MLQSELVNTNTYQLISSSEIDIINKHKVLCLKYNIILKDYQEKLPTLYWIPKLHKRPYKARFIANSTSCTTKRISILLTSGLTAVKSHVQSYCSTTYKNSGYNSFWCIKNSAEFLNKLSNRNFKVSSISTYDFSTLYTTLPHNLIKIKLIGLIRKTFAREECLFLACNDNKAFFTNAKYDRYKLFTCDEFCDALVFLLDNIYIRFGHKVYRQVIGIPMGTNCAPLIADLFLYCYENEFMKRLSKNDSNEDIITAFNDTSRYLDDICNIDNVVFSNMVKDIYPKELQLNKANTSEQEASFLDLHLSIVDGVINTKIYDKRDDFNFNIVNYPYLDGDVPKVTSYGVYMSQLTRFARACTDVEDFHIRNLNMTSKLLQQGYRYHKLCKTFKTFYRKSLPLLYKYNLSLKSYLNLGISQPEFYGDVVYRLRKINSHFHFDDIFRTVINKFVKRGYRVDILERSTRLAFDPIKYNKYAYSLFGGTATFPV